MLMEERKEVTNSTPLPWEPTALLVGTILEAAQLEKARRPAYRLLIDLGVYGVRRSSAQITARYNANELVGTQVIVVLGLPPKRIAGWLSEVLVLGVCTNEGVSLLRPDHVVPNGNIVN
jgi:tRNA-binding protein